VEARGDPASVVHGDPGYIRDLGRRHRGGRGVARSSRAAAVRDLPVLARGDDLTFLVTISVPVTRSLPCCRKTDGLAAAQIGAGVRAHDPVPVQWLKYGDRTLAPQPGSLDPHPQSGRERPDAGRRQRRSSSRFVAFIITADRRRAHRGHLGPAHRPLAGPRPIAVTMGGVAAPISGPADAAALVLLAFFTGSRRWRIDDIITFSSPFRDRTGLYLVDTLLGSTSRGSARRSCISSLPPGCSVPGARTGSARDTVAIGRCRPWRRTSDGPCIRSASGSDLAPTAAERGPSDPDRAGA